MRSDIKLLERAMEKERLVEVEELRERLFLHRETGELRWTDDLRNKYPCKPFERAGRLNTSGYVQICIRQNCYLAHRVSWAMKHGWWPASLIDHKDGDPLNNRPENLRVCTQSQNLQNKKSNKKGTKSGLKGAHLLNGYWAAHIKLDGKQTHLGYFSTPEEAHEAYVAAANENFGEFARAA
jgi:hypothetical protein